MNKVAKIDVLGDYRLLVKFSDDYESIINFRPFLGKGFTKELLEDGEFNKVAIEPGAGIAWENGYDFCPNYLRELAEAKKSVA